jgi:phasin
MNDSFNPQAAVAEFEQLVRNTEVPEAMRALAEKNITQTREVYERSKDAFETVLGNWERSLDAASQGVAALNRKVVDVAQRNINSGFDHAKSLAGAKNLGEAAELQTAYWRKQLAILTAQAEEFRSLSTKVAAHAAAPMKMHEGCV